MDRSSARRRANSVVGIKPTVGLTNWAGVIPISPRQDTVADVVSVLEAIVGFDERDAELTAAAEGFVPKGRVPSIFGRGIEVGTGGGTSQEVLRISPWISARQGLKIYMMQDV